MKVIFCKKCVESNLRYIGSAQHRDQKGDQKTTTIPDTSGKDGSDAIKEGV